MIIIAVIFVRWWHVTSDAAAEAVAACSIFNYIKMPQNKWTVTKLDI